MADEDTDNLEEEDVEEGAQGAPQEDPAPDGGDEDTPAEEPEDSTPPASEDDDPPVRKSSKDYIIDRKNRKIEKLQGNQSPRQEGSHGQGGGHQDDADQGRSVIREEVQSALEPVTRHFQQQADEQELRDALSKHPEAKPMEKTIRRYMESPAYESVPVDFIVRGLLATSGNAAKKQKADSEAAATRTGGSSRRPKEPAKLPDFSKMSDEEFDKWERDQNRS